MSNQKKVVDYILGNVGKLKPEKIEALSKLVGALGTEVEKADNKVPETPNSQDMLEDQPIDMSNVTGVQFEDDKKSRKDIKIYGERN